MTAAIEDWNGRGLVYEVDGGVAWLRLNRPEKRNALDRPLRNALLEAIREVSEDSAVKAAVITGSGSAFCSGADLTQEGGPLEMPPERRLPAPTRLARTASFMVGSGSWRPSGTARRPRLATIAPPDRGPRRPGAAERDPLPDLTIRVGHIKSQLNQSLVANMYQTFRDEVTLLSIGPVRHAE